MSCSSKPAMVSVNRLNAQATEGGGWPTLSHFRTSRPVELPVLWCSDFKNIYLFHREFVYQKLRCLGGLMLILILILQLHACSAYSTLKSSNVSLWVSKNNRIKQVTKSSQHLGSNDIAGKFVPELGTTQEPHPPPILMSTHRQDKNIILYIMAMPMLRGLTIQ